MGSVAGRAGRSCKRLGDGACGAVDESLEQLPPAVQQQPHRTVPMAQVPGQLLKLPRRKVDKEITIICEDNDNLHRREDL